MSNRVPTLTKINSGDQVLDRIQDHITGTLNPVLKQITQQKAVAFNGSITPSLVITSASSWTDLPGTTLAYTVVDAAKRVKAVLMFSGFPSVAAAQVLQVRFVSDGAQVGSAYNFVLTTIGDHRNLAFQWGLGMGALGAAGSKHTVKTQVQVVTGGGSQFNMDSNDSASIIVEELG